MLLFPELNENRNYDPLYYNNNKFHKLLLRTTSILISTSKKPMLILEIHKFKSFVIESLKIKKLSVPT
jgi:hypothetical protein